MRQLYAFLIILCLGVLTFTAEISEGKADESEKSVIHLSQKLRRVLSAEMNAVQKGMTDFAIAIPAGHWNDISVTANKIKETYIFKRKLSAQQIDEFYHAMPDGYRDMDRDFYKTAGQLAEAADKKEKEQVILHYNRLIESCVDCHSTYARDRFPDYQ